MMCIRHYCHWSRLLLLCRLWTPVTTQASKQSSSQRSKSPGPGDRDIRPFPPHSLIASTKKAKKQKTDPSGAVQRHRSPEETDRERERVCEDSALDAVRPSLSLAQTVYGQGPAGGSARP
ncbi:hypothetical protein K431DRAFT_30312 [Polychaeton citri CBS 116435]|uniref:Secreted protein n=1 Tax=Polychaeton citri CBS 116435 TaxID=1314669 RepID=A0A9P4UKL4_9PEZI|nr:hypothetical protein K431DRAFT_30312 [Polychaeton citri CBS 116435]